MQVVWGNDTAAVCEKKGCAFDNVRPEAANLKTPTHPKAMTPALGHEVWGGDCSLNKDLFTDEQLSTWPGQWRAQWVKREACGPHAHAGPRTYRCSHPHAQASVTKCDVTLDETLVVVQRPGSPHHLQFVSPDS